MVNLESQVILGKAMFFESDLFLFTADYSIYIIQNIETQRYKVSGDIVISEEFRKLDIVLKFVQASAYLSMQLDRPLVLPDMTKEILTVKTIPTGVLPRDGKCKISIAIYN